MVNICCLWFNSVDVVLFIHLFCCSGLGLVLCRFVIGCVVVFLCLLLVMLDAYMVWLGLGWWLCGLL